MIHFLEREGRRSGDKGKGAEGQKPRQRQRRAGWARYNLDHWWDVLLPHQWDSGLFWPQLSVTAGARAASFLTSVTRVAALPPSGELQRSSSHVTIRPQAVEEPMCLPEPQQAFSLCWSSDRQAGGPLYPQWHSRSAGVCSGKQVCGLWSHT